MVIDDVTDDGEMIAVRARTSGGPVPCPQCRASTGRVHGYHERVVADVPADGRPVVIGVRVRRMRCPDPGCPVQAFRERDRQPRAGEAAAAGAAHHAATAGDRVDVLGGRTAEVLEGWLREHPGVGVVCRDGSGACVEAARRALPAAVQAGDRWHLRHGPG
ncbi:MAG TPA: transposase family protein [Streptosporangiaceae bacterium]|nr:transposase family protein [Streptosporangiaceae bacterium]